MCAAGRGPTIGGMLTSRLAAHPRRTLLAVLLFVVLAGVFGGPVAGALESSGGFVAPGADSEVAVERLEAATGLEPGTGIVLLVDDPAAAADAGRASSPASPASRRPTPSGRAGDKALVTASLRASAEEDDVAQDALDAFAGRDGRDRRRRRRRRACRSARPSARTSGARS